MSFQFNNKHKSLIIVTTLFFLGLSLRLVKLGTLPPLNRDEAAIGYNAYSILKTGKDEWGQHLPLSFKSFGDYKMPGYIYATILPILVFGLNQFSVRFWSAIGGGISIILVYLIASWVFSQMKWNRSKCQIFAILTVLVFLFNPWHLYFSRVGFEANLNLTFFMSGLTAFLYGLKKRWLLPFSSLGFAATLYTYSSSFIFLPLFIFLLLVLFFKDLFGKKDFWLVLAVFIFLLGLIHSSLSVWQVSQAKASITIFSDPTIIDEFNHSRAEMFKESPLWARLWLNKPLYWGRIFLKNYLLSFSPKFLVISAGAHPWHQIPGMGHFYWLDLPLIVLGLFKLIKKTNKISLFLLFWLVLAPIPSAITVDAPHATRMLQVIPVLILLISLGFGQVNTWLDKKKINFKKFVVSLLVFLYLFQVGRLGWLYFYHYPRNLPDGLLPGIGKAISWVNTQNQDRLIIFSHPFDFSYAYAAFYSRFDPASFQENAVWRKPNPANLTTVEAYGNYRFWEGIPKVEEKAYFVLQKDKDSPEGFSLKKEIVEKGIIQWQIWAN